MKTKPSFEPHLVIKETRVSKGGEWKPHFRGWCVFQVSSGVGYWQEQNGAREIPAGALVVLAHETRGDLRASQLSEVEIRFFCMQPEKLAGLLSLGEQRCLEKAASLETSQIRVFTPGHPVSERFGKLCLMRDRANLSIRVQLLHLIVDLFEGELENGAASRDPEMDGRERLRRLLNQMVAAEFLDLSLSDLAPKMCCSPRHLSRLFRQEVGASFREKQTEVRLGKACELLATTNAKVVEVAMTSGYQSNSLFCLLFKKRFGLSPGKWRRQHSRPASGGRKQTRLLPV